MKRKNIWIFNHYATNMFYEATGRHHGLAKYLVRMGHEVTIFCANTIHNSTDSIALDNKLFIQKEGADGVKYVFIKTSPYKGNGLSRIKNMYDYWINVKKAAKSIAALGIKPDVLVPSSVHPFALVAGLELRRKFNIPCICEIRDLWPESIVAYGKATSNNPIIKLMYIGEKYIYKKADSIIFTMAGGYKYIEDKGWDKVIPKEKVKYICNGADSELYEYNKDNDVILDEDLEGDHYKIVYAGSIREADTTVPKILEVAKIMKEQNDIKFIIYGDGDLREPLAKKAEDLKLTNIVFKGRIEKKYIPYVLSKCDLNILNMTDSSVLKYGGSQNKLFEYLFSGKPILSGENNPFSIINEYNCGISKVFKTEEEIVESILEIKEKAVKYKHDIEVAAKHFDFSELAKDFETCILEVIGEGES